MPRSSNPLVEFLKDAENAPLNAGDISALRHTSPEGGLDTIGFGHKLTREEVKSGKVYGIPLSQLDMESAEAILRRDIEKHSKALDKELRKAHGVKLSELSPRKQMMLIDYQYNPGSAVRKFPSFTEAVVQGDDSRQKDEMIRTFEDAHGVRKPLARNGQFFNAFMSAEAKQRLGE